MLTRLGLRGTLIWDKDEEWEYRLKVKTYRDTLFDMKVNGDEWTIDFVPGTPLNMVRLMAMQCKTVEGLQVVTERYCRSTGITSVTIERRLQLA